MKYQDFRGRLNEMIFEIGHTEIDEENDDQVRIRKHIQQLLKIAGEMTYNLEGWL